MKIKEILEGLLSGEDFSDHNGAESGDEPRPMHITNPFTQPARATDCTFCDAWWAALDLLQRQDVSASVVSPGDPVWITGQIPGRVMGVDTTVRVQVQKGAHGPWAVGRFEVKDITPRGPGPEFTYWHDRDNGSWKRHEASQKMLMILDEDGETPLLSRGLVPEDPTTWRYDFVNVSKAWGPLTQTAVRS